MNVLMFFYRFGAQRVLLWPVKVISTIILLLKRKNVSAYLLATSRFIFLLGGNQTNVVLPTAVRLRLLIAEFIKLTPTTSKNSIRRMCSSIFHYHHQAILCAMLGNDGKPSANVI